MPATITDLVSIFKFKYKMSNLQIIEKMQARGFSGKYVREVLSSEIKNEVTQNEIDNMAVCYQGADVETIFNDSMEDVDKVKLYFQEKKEGTISEVFNFIKNQHQLLNVSERQVQDILNTKITNHELAMRISEKGEEVLFMCGKGVEKIRTVVYGERPVTSNFVPNCICDYLGLCHHASRPENNRSRSRSNNWNRTMDRSEIKT